MKHRESSQLTGAGVGLSGDSAISSNESSLSSTAFLASIFTLLSLFSFALERSKYRDGWLGDAMTEVFRHGVVMFATGCKKELEMQKLECTKSKYPACPRAGNQGKFEFRILGSIKVRRPGPWAMPSSSPNFENIVVARFLAILIGHKRVTYAETLHAGLRAI